MRIIIVGAGTVGTQLARYLVNEKHDVSLIEANEEKARHASNRLDCLVLHDAGNSLATLENAGMAKADVLVCVTDSDEVNMLICGLAESRYPDVIKIARVQNDDYLRINEQEKGPIEDPHILGINYFVHPYLELARSVLDSIEHRAVGDILSFPDTPYELGSIDIAPESSFDGLELKDFRGLVKGDGLITLVERKGESILPSGTTVLRAGDRISVLTKEEDMDGVFKLAGRSEHALRKIGIVGGGRVGALIAEGLLRRERNEKKPGALFSLLKTFIPKSSRRIVIIEKDYALCKELAARFPEALILNEDISDESFVSEERIDDLDLIITTTNNQELNMIAAIYLKSRGVHRAIAMVTGLGYVSIARQLGVDVVLPMQTVVVDTILSHILGGGITGVHRLGDGNVDILELDVNPEAEVAGLSIADFKLPEGGLVLLVNREERSFIPKGDYVFKSGDHIILITKGNKNEIERLFGSSV